jgi:hypothetical protein
MMNWKAFGRKWLWHKRVLFWHLPGETEEKRVTSMSVVHVSAKNHTEYVRVASLECYIYASLSHEVCCNL